MNRMKKQKETGHTVGGKVDSTNNLERKSNSRFKWVRKLLGHHLYEKYVSGVLEMFAKIELPIK